MIDTARLLIRPWRDEDSEPFFRINSDPEVMRHIRPSTTRKESDEAIDRQRAMQAELGHCFWALERREDGAFLGFCGLRTSVPGTPIAGDVEIGWRLGRAFWGFGYAREAAAASLDWAFANLPVPRIVAITVPANTRSWRLMERLGMTRRPDLDFLHPTLPEGDPLRAHITYVMDRR
ncbi:MAG TPA: GNAT family N-acetyltransferase [Allosphingosinicella sp.]|jgi:RimJ/RimL family protein N-acetyltransferase